MNAIAINEHHARRARLGYGPAPIPTRLDRPRFSPLEVRPRAAQRVVARHYGIAIADMLGPSRLRKFAWPRFVAVYLAREITHCSFPKIGGYFALRRHSTIINGWRRVARRVKADPAFAEEIAALAREIEPNLTIKQPGDCDRPVAGIIGLP